VEEKLDGLKSHFDEALEGKPNEERWLMKNIRGERYKPITNVVKEGINIFIEAGSVVNSTASCMTFGFMDYPAFVHYHVYGASVKRCYWDERLENDVRFRKSSISKSSTCICLHCSKCMVCSEALHKLLIYYQHCDGRKRITCPYCTTCYLCDSKATYLQPQGLQKTAFFVTRRVCCITCKPVCKDHYYD